MFRYSSILSDFSEVTMLEREVKPSSSRRASTAGGVVLPLLPSLLAACAPAAELTLNVQATQGKPGAPTAFAASTSCTAEMASCAQHHLIAQNHPLHYMSFHQIWECMQTALSNSGLARSEAHI